MLPRAARLNTKAFAQAFAEGKTARHPLLSVRILRRVDDKSVQSGALVHDQIAKKAIRAAFVVPKKQAKATGRNLVRRRMRECYRLHPALSQRQNALQGCDLIFVATPLAHKAATDELNEAFAQLLRRAARLAGESSGNLPDVSSQNETDETKPSRF